MSAGFRVIHLIDQDQKSCAQLQTLTDALRPSLAADTEVFVRCGDANDLVLAALGSIPAWMPALVFLDPEKTDVRWETLENIAARRTTKGRRPELLINFPMDFVLLRQLPIGGSPLGAGSLNRLFGTDEWAQLPSVQQRGQGARRTVETRADLVGYYARRI